MRVLLSTVSVEGSCGNLAVKAMSGRVGTLEGARWCMETFGDRSDGQLTRLLWLCWGVDEDLPL